MPPTPQNTQALTVVEAQSVGKPSLQVHDFESVLRFALEKGASLTEITAVRRELKAEQAKEQFDLALAEFQAACPVIYKQKSVPDGSGKQAYAYAPLEDIIAQVKPLLRQFGFSYTLDTDTESKDGWVIAKCHLTHAGGHTSTSTAKFPLGAGTRLMSATQVYAATLTFASRRAFSNALGIVTAGEDQDGRTSAPKPAGPNALAGASATAPARADVELKRKLVDLTRSIHFAKGYALDEIAKGKLLMFLVDECILGDTEGFEELHGQRLVEVVNKVQTKLQSK